MKTSRKKFLSSLNLRAKAPRSEPKLPRSPDSLLSCGCILGSKSNDLYHEAWCPAVTGSYDALEARAAQR